MSFTKSKRKKCMLMKWEVNTWKSTRKVKYEVHYSNNAKLLIKAVKFLTEKLKNLTHQVH